MDMQIRVHSENGDADSSSLRALSSESNLEAVKSRDELLDISFMPSECAFVI